MFIIVLKKGDVEKVYTQMFTTEKEASDKLNDFKPDYTGYVCRAARI